MEWKLIAENYIGALVVFVLYLLTVLWRHWVFGPTGGIRVGFFFLHCGVLGLLFLGATLRVSWKLEQRRISPEEKEALSPKLYIRFSPIYHDPEFSPYKYPLYAYSFLVRNDNKESASISDLAMSFVFKCEIEKTNAGAILDTGGPIIDGRVITETKGERAIVSEGQPQEIHASGAPELRVKLWTVNGKPLNTNQADLACAKWPRGCVFRGRVVVNVEKPPVILQGMGTYFGQYHYQIKDEIFTEQIRDVIPEPNDTLLKAEYHYDQARDRADNKQYDEAITEYNKAIGLNPKYADAYFYRALCYSRKRDYPKAILDNSKAIELSPTYADAYFNRAGAYAESQKYSEAIQDYTRYIGMKPEDPQAHFGRGRALHEDGQSKKAISDFTEAIGFNPEYGESFYYRALSWVRLGKKEKGVIDMKKACDLGIKEACDAYDKLTDDNKQ